MPRLLMRLECLEDLDFDREFIYEVEVKENYEALLAASRLLGHNRVEKKLFDAYLGSIPI